MTALQEFPGVLKADLDSVTWKVSVRFRSGSEDPAGLITHFEERTDFTLARIGTLAEVEIEDSAGLDIVTVSKAGESFEVKESLADGKFTIVDFFADWCVPCKKLEAKIVEFMKGDPQIALRKVNIVDWEREVAKEMLAGVKGIPYVIVFDTSGKELYRGVGVFEDVFTEISAARERD